MERKPSHSIRDATFANLSLSFRYLIVVLVEDVTLEGGHEDNCCAHDL